MLLCGFEGAIYLILHVTMGRDTLSNRSHRAHGLLKHACNIRGQVEEPFVDLWKHVESSVHSSQYPGSYSPDR
jgi:hypothetical protein